MKKFTSTDLGGAPVNKNDLRDIFNSETWAAIQGLMSQHDLNTEGIILTGCAISGSGPYDIGQGIVYLNGEFMRYGGNTGQTLPVYLVPATPINDSRTFQDLTVNVVAITKNAAISGSIPGSGQYVAITSPTDPDDRRWNPATQTQVTTLQTNITSEASTRSTNDAVISGGTWQSVSLSASDITNGSGINPTSIGTSEVEYRIGEKEVFVFIKLKTVVFAAIPNAIRVLVPSAIRTYLNAALGTNDNLVTGSSDNNGGPPNRLAINGQYDGTNHWIEFAASSYSGNDFIDTTQNNLTCQFFVKV